MQIVASRRPASAHVLRVALGPAGSAIRQRQRPERFAVVPHRGHDAVDLLEREAVLLAELHERLDTQPVAVHPATVVVAVARWAVEWVDPCCIPATETLSWEFVPWSSSVITKMIWASEVTA